MVGHSLGAATWSLPRGDAMRIVLLCAALLIAVICCSLGTSTAQGPAGGEEVTIYRDNFGIPNIFAATEEGAVFGMGYAQAEDRLEEVARAGRHVLAVLVALRDRGEDQQAQECREEVTPCSRSPSPYARCCSW